MSYYEKGQTVKYKEDAGPTAVVLAREELLALIDCSAIPAKLGLRLEEREGEFFAPKLVLRDRGRDLDLCQRTYQAIVAAMEGGLDEEDVALLLSTAAYDLYGPAGAHGGCTDDELPEGAVDHDAYWAAIESAQALPSAHDACPEAGLQRGSSALPGRAADARGGAGRARPA